MKLYIKQKVFSFVDDFTVRDEQGLDRYRVKGEFFSLGHRLHIYDEQGAEVAYIQQKLMSLMGRFIVYIGGEEAAQVVREFSLLKPSYRIEGLPWRLEGDFFSHEYTLTDGPRQLMTISKQWFTWGDSYELNIAEGINELLCLAIVLAVDSENESANANA